MQSPQARQGYVADDQLPLNAHVDGATRLLKVPDAKSALRRIPQADAGVLGQIVERPWCRSPGKIGWRGHDSHAHVRPNPDGNHVLREGFAKAHASIEPLGDDIDKAIVDADLYVEIRINRQEPGDRGQQDRLGGLVADGDPHGASRFVAQLSECGETSFDPVKMRGDRAQEAFAGLGCRYAARRPIKQPQAKPPFKAKVAKAEIEAFTARLEAIDAILQDASPHDVLTLCARALADVVPNCCEAHQDEFKAEFLRC